MVDEGPANIGVGRANEIHDLNFLRMILDVQSDGIADDKNNRNWEKRWEGQQGTVGEI